MSRSRVARVEYRMSADRQVVTARFLGVLDEDIVAQSVDFLIGLSSWRPEYHLIVDASEVDEVDISLRTIGWMGGRTRAEDRQTGRTAVVIGDHALRRTFAKFVVEVLNTTSQSRGRVFDSYAEAERWVRGGGIDRSAYGMTPPGANGPVAGAVRGLSWRQQGSAPPVGPGRCGEAMRRPGLRFRPGFRLRCPPACGRR